jgi:hypothetical protein
VVSTLSLSLCQKTTTTITTTTTAKTQDKTSWYKIYIYISIRTQQHKINQRILHPNPYGVILADHPTFDVGLDDNKTFVVHDVQPHADEDVYHHHHQVHPYDLYDAVLVLLVVLTCCGKESLSPVLL